MERPPFHSFSSTALSLVLSAERTKPVIPSRGPFFAVELADAAPSPGTATRRG